MLISLKLNNVYIYDSEIEFNLTTDKQTKRFLSNTVEVNGEKVVKSAVILGPNNCGKTNLIRCISMIKDFILDHSPYHIEANMFSDNPVCSMDITFDYEGKIYGLALKYDTNQKEFISEEYYQVLKRTKVSILHAYKARRMNVDVNKDFFGESVASLKLIVTFASHERLVINTINTGKIPAMKTLKEIFYGFADKVDVVDMNHIQIGKTIEMMKSSEENQRKIANFIKCADLSLDDFRYLNDSELKISFDSIDKNVIESRIPEKLKTKIYDQLHLCSIYKGKPVPSFLFDSVGTQKMAALASYVINALEEGRILVIDEIDSSLHFKLTRSIFSLFNNDLNTKGQLICTAHDISLLDCRRMFRKEQILFAAKDSDGVYLYPLSEFTSDEDGIRETSDLVEKYRRGIFGALPSPDMFQVLYDSCRIQATDDQERDDNE